MKSEVHAVIKRQAALDRLTSGSR